MDYFATHKYYIVNIAASLLVVGSWLGLRRWNLLALLVFGLESLAGRKATQAVVFLCPLLVLLLAHLAAPPVVGGDSASYFQSAADFSSGLGISTVPWSRGTGVAVIYGSLFWLFGSASTLAFQFINVVFAAGSVWLIYPLALRLGVPRYLGMIGVVVGAFSLSFICRSVMLMTEIPAAFFSMLALWALVQSLKQINKLRFATLALSLLALILLRPENLFLAALSCCLLASAHWKNWRLLKRPRNFVFLIVITLTVAAPLLLVALDRYQRFGSWDLKGGTGVVLFSGLITFGTQQGYDFLAQENPELQRIWTTVTRSPSPDAYPNARFLTDIEPDMLFLSYSRISGESFAATDRLFADAAWRAWRLDPLAMSRLLVWKGYVYLFQDVKVRAIVGLAGSSKGLAQVGEKVVTARGRQSFFVNNMVVIDSKAELLFGHIRTGPPSFTVPVDVIVLLQAGLQKWNAVSGLFWNHLALAGILIMAWRARLTFAYVAVLLFTLVRLLLPIILGLGDQRFYLPGYPLYILALLLTLDLALRTRPSLDAVARDGA